LKLAPIKFMPRAEGLSNGILRAISSEISTY
jgi:hypothetical protein